MHIVITGASKRVGFGLAERFINDGHYVSMHVRSQPSNFQEFCRVHEHKTHVIIEDLLQEHALNNLYARLTKKFGPADLLINNVSNFEPDRATDFSHDMLQAHMRVNLETAITLSRDMYRDNTRGDASIINITDQRVSRLNPNFFTYTLAKSSLWTATITMAQEFAPNIRVNAIGPGPTLMNKRQNNEDFEKQIAALPLKQMVSVQDIYRTACFLAQSSCITGQLIHVDSGQHLAWQTPDVVGINE